VELKASADGRIQESIQRLALQMPEVQSRMAELEKSANAVALEVQELQLGNIRLGGLLTQCENLQQQSTRAANVRFSSEFETIDTKMEEMEARVSKQSVPLYVPNPSPKNGGADEAKLQAMETKIEVLEAKQGALLKHAAYDSHERKFHALDTKLAELEVKQTAVGQRVADGTNDIQEIAARMKEVGATLEQVKQNAPGERTPDAVCDAPSEAKIREAKIQELEALVALSQHSAGETSDIKFRLMDAKFEELKGKQFTLGKHTDSRISSLWKQIDGQTDQIEEVMSPRGKKVMGDLDKDRVIASASMGDVGRSQSLWGLFGQGKADQEVDVPLVNDTIAKQGHDFGGATLDINSMEDLLGKVVGPIPILVTIQSVSGLRISSTNLCLCGEIVGKPGSTFQTKVAAGTLNPSWDERHEIAEFGFRDQLKFWLCDKQTWPMQDIILGEAILPGRDVYTNDFANRLKLSGGLPGLQLFVTVTRLGLTVQHSELRAVTSDIHDARAAIEMMQTQRQSERSLQVV